MSEGINMHKRIAMYGEAQSNKLKKGGKVKKYAKGGQVNFEGSDSGQPDEITHQKNVNKITAYPEKKVAKLPAKGSVKPLTKPMPHSIATMKKGGVARKHFEEGGSSRLTNYELQQLKDNAFGGSRVTNYQDQQLKQLSGKKRGGSILHKPLKKAAGRGR